MVREKDLLKNTIILSIGKFLPQLFNIVTIPLLTYHLTKTEYGTYDLINTLVSLLLPIATLQIHSAAFRFLIDKREDVEEQKKIISNIYVFTIPMSMITLFFFYIVSSNIVYSTRILMSAYLMLDTIYITQGQVIRGLAYNKIYAVAAVMASASKCVVIIMSMKYFKAGLNGVLLAIIASYMISSFYIMCKVPISFYFNLKYISCTLMKQLISYSWPMIPNNLSTWILNISDRTVITFFLGLEANALYAAANNIPNIVNMAKAVVVMAWQENASIALTDENATEYYSEMFKKFYALVAGFTAILIAMSPLIYRILIKGAYDEGYTQVPILIIGFFYSCVSAFQGGIYIAHKRTRNVGFTTMTAAMINVIVDLSFVNVIGIFAGSISTLISYFTLFVYRLIGVTKFQKMNYSYIHILSISVILAIMTIVELLQNTIAYSVNFVIGVIFAYIINEKIVKNAVSECLRRIKRIKEEANDN